MTTTINGQEVKIVKRNSGDYLVIMIKRRGCNFVAKTMDEIYKRLQY
jgi:hypothetical protein